MIGPRHDGDGEHIELAQRILNQILGRLRRSHPPDDDDDATKPTAPGYGPLDQRPPKPGWRRSLIAVGLLLLVLGVADRTHVIRIWESIHKPDTEVSPEPEPRVAPPRALTSRRDTTAICQDSTLSFSRHASGTCSGHGGVRCWIHHPGRFPPTSSPYCTSLAGRREEQLQ